ncbi:MAG: histidine phosphatase family protein [Desulfobulbus sp.]|jgi:probable phosphoglycerate mutase|nr:histidine phosphatase family protein [Desulfobulbus sp.]
MNQLIFLLRHGAVDNPSPRRFLGRTDLALNAEGIRQARDLGQWLGLLPFRRVCASPLARAMQTAALVSGRPMENIERIAALAEIDLGEWDGLRLVEIQARFPGAYEQRGQDLAGYRPQGGESFADVAGRACPALAELGRSMSGPLLVVAHMGVNRAILSRLLHRPLAQLLDIPQAYATVNILRAHPQGLEVVAVNLQGEPLPLPLSPTTP